jgi:hypothetical protein
MSIDQIEIILLMYRSMEAKIGGARVRVEGDPSSFAVDADEDCVLIGAISQQLQTKSDMHRTLRGLKAKIGSSSRALAAKASLLKQQSICRLLASAV